MSQANVQSHVCMCVCVCAGKRDKPLRTQPQVRNAASDLAEWRAERGESSGTASGWEKAAGLSEIVFRFLLRRTWTGDSCHYERTLSSHPHHMNINSDGMRIHGRTSTAHTHISHPPIYQAVVSQSTHMKYTVEVNKRAVKQALKLINRSVKTRWR